MNFTIRGKNFEVTPAIRAYVEEKVAKIERYFDEKVEANAHINLKVYHKGEHKAEVTVPLSGLVLRAEDTNDDIYAAIDVVVDKLERQIRKHKTKINRKFREKGHEHDYFSESTVSFDDHEQEETSIKRIKTFELEPMNAEEAVLQMNLLGHNFFLFLDGETGKTCAVYRRNNDSVGLIETK